MAEQDVVSESNVGKVVEVKGVVIDAVFPGALPEINNALQISIPGIGGSEVQIGGLVGPSLADMNIEAKIVLDAPGCWGM